MIRIPVKLRRRTSAIAIGALLSACGGGSDGEVATALTLTGSVGDGPVIGATVTVRAADGRVLTSTASDNASRYQVTVQVTSDDFPLILEASGGTDLVTGAKPDFTLVSATWEASRNEVHLTPFSTLAVRSAGAMAGGLSGENLEQARERVTANLAFGLDSGRLGDPMNGRVDEENIADLVKASEAFGEMLRRVRAVLGEGGSTLSVDGVITALGADLTDGIIDGVGAGGVEPHVAVLANVVTGAVMLEVLANRLQVNGADAIRAMDNAVRAVEPAAVRVTSDVPVNERALTQVREALQLAGIIAPDDALSEFVSELERLESNLSANDFQRLLDEGAQAVLERAVREAGTGDQSLVTVVNLAARVIRGQEKKVNEAPVISGTPATTVNKWSPYSFVPSASDPDGDTLLFQIRNQPAWASFDPTTGALTGTPGNGDVGTAGNIVISVSDGIESAKLAKFDLEVLDVNGPPVISGTPMGTATAGMPYSFTPIASDPDGDQLTFTITNKPGWAAFDTRTGTLSGTAGEADIGKSSSGIVISVSDGEFSATLPVFAIAVQATPVQNTAPTIGGVPPTIVAAGSNYTFTPVAADADDDPLQFTIANRPTWASFDPATGTLSGRPEAAHVGTTSGITISVSDGKANTSLPPFSLTVQHVNSAPTISGTPATTVNKGVFYSFTPTAHDADGDPLTFSIQNKPVWASFDATTGRLFGTPGTEHNGTTAGITIRVSDLSVTSSLPAFDLTVVNRPPTISGTPATTLEENTAYSFTPTASDPDGDPLSFSITNKPAWAAFDNGTGQLYGTPATTGKVDGIIISVSDGVAAAALAPFNLTVTAAVSEGTVTLSWEAPTRNVDGTALTDLAGYRVYYGTSSRSYGTPIDVEKGLVTYTLDGLEANTWYFAVTALDSDGNESEHSNELSATVGG